MAVLMALHEFQRIMETEGEDAAIEWANEQTEMLEGLETSPQLRLIQ